MLALSLALVGFVALSGPPPELPSEVDPPADAADPPADAADAADAAEPPVAEPPVADPPADAAEPPVAEPPAVEPPAPRNALPAGLEVVPFPLEQTRGSTPAPPIPNAEMAPLPVPERRSIIDLRDPFSRPPTTPSRPGDVSFSRRMLLPDLKDPFAPEARRVRSTTLERQVPNDIRDPFHGAPRPDSPRPPCAKTLTDGTVVQRPGDAPLSDPRCTPATLDLRDPFPH